MPGNMKLGESGLVDNVAVDNVGQSVDVPGNKLVEVIEFAEVLDMWLPIGVISGSGLAVDVTGD